MPDDSIKVLTKGADSVIFPLLSKDFDPDESIKEKTIKDLKYFAKDGLRTLLLCEKKISLQFY
jgi:magnesium-transporting ATPase (P-type)